MNTTLSAPKFSSLHAVPPGGKFFCEIAGTRFEGASLSEICAAVRPELARLRVPVPAEEFVAAYMCPRLGPVGKWFCKGTAHGTVSGLRPVDVMSASEKYFGRKVVPSDEVSVRLGRCLSCPKHERRWCLTCPGHLARILEGFGKVRPRVALDPKSGVCMCAGAYEAAICSVDWGDAPAWPDAPSSCWRRS